jgi:prepilin-type N-terminal cleavage/methylation domain-containing protein
MVQQASTTSTMPSTFPESPRRRGERVHDLGFTVIELVAAIVILGVLATVALQAYRSLRFDARRAGLESIRSTIVTNATNARAAWLARGSGSSVTLQGRTFEVFDADTVTMVGNAPAGSPTTAGMFAMLGCNPADFVMTWAPMRCAALPGYLLAASDWYLAVWVEATSSTWNSTNCAVAYWPGAEPFHGDPYYEAFDHTSDAYYYPAPPYPGGC